MKIEESKLLFISISDVANGAEQLMLLSASACKAPIIFLKNEKRQHLTIPSEQQVTYVSHKHILLGLLLLPLSLIPYSADYTIMSTHPYLNAYIGLLKRLKFISSKVIVRECSSVFTRYSGFKQLSYKIAYRLGYPGINRVVCQTELMRNDFIKYNQFFPRKNVLVGNNPIDKDQLLKDAKSDNQSISECGNYVCAAGRLIPEKNFDGLLYAFKIVINARPELRLIILGEGPERYRLSELIDQLDLRKSVILKGWVKNPMPYFKNAKVCIISSLKEGFPNVLLQMMALNARVVATRCAGGIKEIPGILTVPIDDPKSLSAAILFALDNLIPDSQQQKTKYLDKRSPRAYLTSIFDNL